MNEITVRLVGVVPLMMHNNQSVNPFNKYFKAINPISDKRKKTTEDKIKLSRLEWEAGLYIHDGIIVVPGRCIDASFQNGAKRTKEGRKWLQGAMIIEDYCQLDYKGRKNKKYDVNGNIPSSDLDELFKTNCTMDLVRVDNKTIIRARPIFYDWSFQCTIAYDEGVFNYESIVNIVNETGKYIGLLERRPRYGRFTAEIIK